MILGTLSEYGIFDSSVRFPGKAQTQFRKVTEFEIEYFISATGRAVIGDRYIRIRPGTLLIAKPGQIRRSILPFSCFYFHIALVPGSEYYEMLMNTPDFYPIIDNNVYRPIFESLVKHLLDVGYAPDSDFINAKILEIFYYLFRDADCNRNGLLLPSGESNPAIQKAAAFMEENYPNPIGLAEIAEAVGYSPTYFHSIFTKVMGKTPQKYLLDIRIRHAKYLLARTKKQMREIAMECGFMTQSYFITRFKAETLTTPTQYRRCIGDRYVSIEEIEQ